MSTFIRVSNERVIAGKMRTPGEVIDVPDADAAQAIRDGYAKATTSSAKTKEPAVKATPAKAVGGDIRVNPDPKVQPQPTESLQKADPHPQAVANK